jgi:hypothetical protein
MKLALGTIVCALLLAGCGGTKTQSTTQAAAPPPLPTSTPATTTSGSGPSGLQAEATAAAQGDIPDNQVFLVFANAKAGYSMKYPEGWAQSGRGANVTIRDKNNIVRVEVRPGTLSTFAAIHRDLASTHIMSGPQKVTLRGRPEVKVTYSTQSTPNPVTGKRVTLVTDRYYLSNGTKEAVVDLGTPQGVDNIDAYRLMIESFTWK